MSKTVEVSNEVQALHDRVVSILETRANSDVDKGQMMNDHKRAFLLKEARLFNVHLAQVLHDHSIDPSFYGDIAIYAIDKVRAILRTVASNVNSLDKYSHAILINALMLKTDALANKTQSASLCRDLEVSESLRVRLQKAYSTASTQASSSRKALCALGVCVYDNEKREIRFNEDSKMLATLRKILRKEIKAS